MGQSLRQAQDSDSVVGQPVRQAQGSDPTWVSALARASDPARRSGGSGRRPDGHLGDGGRDDRRYLDTSLPYPQIPYVYERVYPAIRLIPRSNVRV